jgi:hypothetical protein
MNPLDESNTALPAASENKVTLTYAVPHILLKRDTQNGFPVLQVRIGEPRQIEHVISVEYSEQEVDETAQLFVIKAKNRINFGIGAIEVLNDAVEGDSPLAASAPTATEYMNNVGKEVLISFSCNRDPTILNRQAFRIVRSKIVLP